MSIIGLIIAIIGLAIEFASITLEKPILAILGLIIISISAIIDAAISMM